MCECGCTSNDLRYSFPGPGKKVYLLTLSAGCTDCDSPSGVSIERMDRSHFMLKEPDWIDGTLPFEKWPAVDSEGVAIVTGMRKHEFVAALLKQVIGVDASYFGDDKCIDEAGAETLLEDMYEESVVKPHFPTKADR